MQRRLQTKNAKFKKQEEEQTIVYSSHQFKGSFFLLELTIKLIAFEFLFVVNTIEKELILCSLFFSQMIPTPRNSILAIVF